MKTSIRSLSVLLGLALGMGCHKSALTPGSGSNATTTPPRSVTGIGGYQLNSGDDKAIAIDWKKSGIADHILLYRPGLNLVTVVENTGTSTNPVYVQVYQGSLPGITATPETDPTNDVGGDHLIAYDYESVGTMDDLVYWLPGTGKYAIYTHDCPACGFTLHENSLSTGAGLAGYNLAAANDKIIAYDWSGNFTYSGLICYRPGNGIVWVMKNTGPGTFTVTNPGSAGIGGYDLRGATDQIIALDYQSSGTPKDLALYRPGVGYCWILEHDQAGNTFNAVFTTRTGFPEFSLTGNADRMFAFSYRTNGFRNSLFCYRPGAGLFAILERSGAGYNASLNALSGGFFGYPLNSPPSAGISGDRGFALDQGEGRYASLVLYAPSTDRIDMFNNTQGGNFTNVF